MGMRSLDDSKDGIAKFLTRNPSTNFVAKINNEIIGVILSGHDGRRGYIYHASVNVNYRNQGVGTKLLEAVYKSMKEEGINKVALVVFKTNDIGNTFWKSSGLEERNDLNYYNISLNSQNI
ncbi:ribosomal protein S18 acetylase RimI-like enzyme [Sedimentibacter acidaminivorans]|uniref:Ribosomal protein S18 acetylase RimI-like enzyme n=2 Tax=Sedimentibacter acidaminivorans TaxID=913099 RepID=A0ABS4GCH1_9FIRM|nr:GNAT family N-acetyltransferase [Sedimentibacter acidaminivorans]MBP1925383.1 ribosomal protein S18 acetylase RimI-like enzyme [Sedimentibacter acidaminivorans]